MKVLGLMSGTSADGVDAVLAKFEGYCNKPKWNLINHISLPYGKNLKRKIINFGQGKSLTSKNLFEMAEEITEVHATAALTCDPSTESLIVGCHGQTIFHRPPYNGRRGGSLQLVQAPLLAKELGRTIIHDFRSLDMAFGGQGAPLVPMVDDALLGRINGWRAVLNLGGISNLTLLPPNSGSDRFASVLGWDCGPANSLLDLAIQKISNGKFDFDLHGSLAKRGVPNEEMISIWLKESYFQLLPPKSTGREQFGREDLQKRIKDLSPISDEDLLATLTAFTASIVAQDLRNLYTLKSINPIELVIAGGGCFNKELIRQIINRCRGMRVISIEDFGIPKEAREALAFALLAWWHVHRYPGNSPQVTGARKPLVLGTRVNPEGILRSKFP